LQNHLHSIDFYDNFLLIQKLSGKIAATYLDTYKKAHEDRSLAFGKAVDEIKGRAEWMKVPEELKSSELLPLTTRACTELKISPFQTSCQHCSATIKEMESDLVAVNGLKSQIIERIQEIISPKKKIERVRLAEFFVDALEDETSLEKALENLREHLIKLMQEENVKVVVE